MYVIGLTGGIASGKSVVSRRWAEHGAVVVDADLLAREVVEPGQPALAAIAREFGDSVIAADGGLDRPALGALIFSDAAARLKLNGITHPAVWARAKELFEAADPDATVVYDVPLLAEAAADRPLRFDRIVVVDASQETRVRRLVELRGLSEEEARRRIASQAGDAERLAIADDVIDSNGTLDETLAGADALWAKLAARES
jgi:dephospho-CoA kinase